MKMKWMALSGLAAAALLAPVAVNAIPAATEMNESTALIAQAQPNRESRGQRGGRRGGGMKRMLEQLNLSSEQSSRIEAIFEQARSENEGLREEMRAAREQMESLMAGNASADQLRQQHNVLQRLHQQKADRRFETMLSVREVLTSEQRAQLAELKQSRPGREGRGRGGRGQRQSES